MERLFIQLSDDVEILNLEKFNLMTGFVVQGHKYGYILVHFLTNFDEQLQS